MKTKYVACALLLNSRNQILIQSRTGISKYGEEWSFFGGSLEAGENSQEALFREIKEELGYDISDWEMLYLGEIIHDMKKFDLQYHRFIYGIRVPDDTMKFDDQEGSGAFWFSLDEVRKLKFNTDIIPEIRQLEKHFIKSVI